MKKQSMADKMAQKSFFNPQFQKNWAAYQKSFGPILKPAFPDNYQAKVHLCTALNHINSKNMPQALLSLNALQKHLNTDADKAAFLFFMGLFCEYAGRFDQMADLYAQANALNHTFYLPYLKVAKYHMDGCIYDVAADNYRAAIGCFDPAVLSDQDRKLMGTAYINLASCLAMMHRYEEAENTLAASRELISDAPGRAAPEAILHAVRGEKELAESCLLTLKNQAPNAYESMKKSVENIFAGTEPQFFEVPVEEANIAAFWTWFASNSADLQKKLNKQDYEAVIAAVGDHLLEAFPFLGNRPYVALGKNDTGYVIQLKDRYAPGIIKAYGMLQHACPEEIKSAWLFDVIH